MAALATHALSRDLASEAQGLALRPRRGRTGGDNPCCISVCKPPLSLAVRLIKRPSVAMTVRDTRRPVGVPRAARTYLCGVCSAGPHGLSSGYISVCMPRLSSAACTEMVSEGDNPCTHDRAAGLAACT